VKVWIKEQKLKPARRQDGWWKTTDRPGKQSYGHQGPRKLSLKLLEGASSVHEE